MDKNTGLNVADKVNELLTWHVPTTANLSHYTPIQSAARTLADAIFKNVPDGDAKTNAIRNLGKVVYFCQTGIATDGLSF